MGTVAKVLVGVAGLDPVTLRIFANIDCLLLTTAKIASSFFDREWATDNAVGLRDRFRPPNREVADLDVALECDFAIAILLPRLCEPCKGVALLCPEPALSLLWTFDRKASLVGRGKSFASPFTFGARISSNDVGFAFSLTLRLLA